MFCQNCGAAIEPGVKFCPNCGTTCDVQPAANTAPAAEPTVVQPAAPSPAQQSAYAAPAYPQPAAPVGSHPYHELGGFLQFLAIMYSYIVPVILILGAIGVLGKLVGIGFFNGKIIANLILTLANSGISAWFSIRIGKQIRQKNTSFLETYQQMAIVNVVCSFLITLVGQGFFNAIGTLIGTALGCFLLNLYYVKSVRVRTYMGTDEYLKKSLFNKNTQAPASADGSQNTL